MRVRFLILTLLTFSTLYAQEQIMSVHLKGGGSHSHRVAEVDSITFRSESPVPEIRINTIPYIDEIAGKEEYMQAIIQVDGKGVYPDFEGVTEIKGRGNSTWSNPKKPYRLKLSKKESILGFKAAKNYVLLAGYIDPTLMCDPIGYKIGELIGVPFSNRAQPVDVILNGKYRGSYVLTEQIELHESRISIDKENSIVWELDAYMDSDPFQFYSTAFTLPVMLKDIDQEDEANFNYWKADLDSILTIFSREPLEANGYENYIDMASVVNYLLVTDLTRNMEINHPKSVYLHKTKGGKYTFGPVWDFDWAFGYNRDTEFTHFCDVNENFFTWYDLIGNVFFKRFLKDSRVKTMYKQRWQSFRANGGLETLLAYVDSYAKQLHPSAVRNSQLWPQTADFTDQVANMKSWLTDRAKYIDSKVTQY